MRVSEDALRAPNAVLAAEADVRAGGKLNRYFPAPARFGGSTSGPATGGDARPGSSGRSSPS